MAPSPTSKEPRLRFIDLASEAAGRPFSVWVPADQGPEAIEEEVARELAARSPYEGQEGWALQEVAGFGDNPPSTDESLAEIAQLGRIIAEHGPIVPVIFAREFQSHLGDIDSLEYVFRELYVGAFPTLADWGKQLAERMELQLDELLAPHIDWAAFARDAESEGHFSSVTDADGQVHVFLPEQVQ